MATTAYCTLVFNADGWLAGEFDGAEPSPRWLPADWERVRVSRATRAALDAHRDPAGRVPHPRAVRALSWDDVRLWRDVLLRATDYVEGRTYATRNPLAAVAWDAWRTQLFNITASCPDPNDVAWPEPPGAVNTAPWE